jgi:hypothetical protein
MDRIWLTDEQFAKIAPHLPTDTRGKERVDDRRVISGIVHVLKSGVVSQFEFFRAARRMSALALVTDKTLPFAWITA